MTPATAAERLAVLLAAGIAPTSAWTWITDERTDDVAGAMQRRGWRELAAAWTVAMASGAPLAPALRNIAAGLRDAEQTQRDIGTALAGPVATARLVLALPVVGVLFGVALGFDTIRTLVATPLGWMCLGAGAGLVLLAMAWNRILVRQARPPGAAPGLGCDLVVVALGGGAPVRAALVTVQRVSEELGLSVDLTRLQEVLDLSERAGVPAGELLASAAVEARRMARSDGQAAAARLGVLLMLPLGLCILPAFFAVGVVPLLATVLGATFGATG